MIRAGLRFLLAPVSARTWREIGYCVTGTIMAVPPFLLAVLGVVGSVLSLVTVGLPVLVGVLLVARSTVRYFRLPARLFLRQTWPNPPRLRRRRGLVGRAGAVLGDGTAWRALVYCLIHLPLTAAATYVGAAGIIAGIATLTNPLSRATNLGFYVWYGPPPAVVSLAALLLFPWYFRLIVWIDRWLAHTLLEPSPDRARIAALESSRAALQADATALLRRVERDLHDGTQARLVGLGVALSRIGRRVDDPPVRAMVTDAQHAVVEALGELREIVRGVHPPALDAGLATALETLAARSAVPVELEVVLPNGAPPATESALYFGAAELLTNVARHADATRVRLGVAEEGDALRLTVTDDGRGGARADGTGSGLAGLRRRAAALDGSLVVHSPPGGPTTVEMRLPRDA